MPCWATPAKLCHAVPCHATPCHVVPRHVMPRHSSYAMPCCATPCHSSHAMPPQLRHAVPSQLCHATPAVPCRAVPCHPAWPCPASPSRFLPSAASSSGAAESPATPLIITGPAGACSPPRWTSRRWRASGNAGLSRPGPGRQRARVHRGVRGLAAALRGCARADSVPRRRDKGLQCWCVGVQGFAVPKPGCARACSVGARGFAVLAHDGARVCSARTGTCEGLQCWCVVVQVLVQSAPPSSLGVSAEGWASVGTSAGAVGSQSRSQSPGVPAGP